jgi:hypothetical protein
MKTVTLFMLIGLLLSPTMVNGQEIYRWVDEKGTVNFTDDLGLVPEKYLDQVQKKKPPQEPAPSPSTQIPKGVETVKESESAPEPKDMLGRGEDWWKAKVKEWNEKLLKAQKNYETAYATWKTKERELEESKFKPDSLKRRLKAEIKDLEVKVKDWEKQMEEARNMLEKVLLKQ